MKRVVKVTRATIAKVVDGNKVEDKIVLETVGKHLSATQILNKYHKTELYEVGDFIKDVNNFECTYEMPIEEFVKLAELTEEKEVGII